MTDLASLAAEDLNHPEPESGLACFPWEGAWRTAVPVQLVSWELQGEAERKGGGQSLSTK